jgi:hypothetical protein
MTDILVPRIVIESIHTTSPLTLGSGVLLLSKEPARTTEVIQSGGENF